jgi:cell division protein FtsQ
MTLLKPYLRPLLKTALLVLTVLLVLEVAFHLVAAPNLRLSKLVFTGDRPLLDGTAGDLLGLRDHEYYFSVDEKALKTRLEALPWVKTARVDKKFPDTLAVDLRVRQALALSLVGGAVLSVDDQGTVFRVTTDARGLDLPIISGVTFESLKPGSQFPEAVRPLFDRLAELRKNSPGLFRSISEVQLARNDRGGFDAVVYPAHTPVRILLGDRWDQATLQQMFVLLDLVARQGWTAKTKEIDFRATPVVLRPRES